MGPLFVLIAMLLNPATALAGSIRSVEIGPDEVTLRFDDLVAGASTFILAGPDRIALDISGAEAGAARHGSRLLPAVRQGQ
ncbi:MAG: N-acetylmuramoyl-L-alanine amidase, partial [Sphingopyxis sp.]|nr:N-acetylmuramoyl-L-alanine amidase [Sphingopyxis sp.]